MSRVLVVEDEPVIRQELRRVLGQHGFEVSVAGDVAEAERLGLEGFDLILTDLRLPGPPGDTLIDKAPGVPVIVMTAYGSVPSAVDAMKRGAVDYIGKPFDPDELVLIVERTLRQRRPEPAPSPAGVDPRGLDPAQAVGGMVGRSPAMLGVFERIAKVAPTDAKVLVLGESGTGKELVARALHAHSPRHREAFVAVNCASIPEGLIESELFGHERGAFTGAVQRKGGLVEAAHRGTLFLDEIGELPLSAQARLLRMLQHNEVRRVGANQAHHVDVRLVAATHRHLAGMVAAGDFREDLYFRLRVVEVILPPLRERGDDITALAHVFLERLGQRLGRVGLYLAPDALAAMRAYEWPGNVRELENAIERAVILHDGGPIGAAHLGLSQAGYGGGAGAGAGSAGTGSAGTGSAGADAGSAGASGSFPGIEPAGDDVSLEGYFKAFVLRHQDELGETALAKRLGISRKTLWERRQRLGIPRRKK